MSAGAGRKALGVTSAELKATIAEAENQHLAAALQLGEALVVQRAMPDRDVASKQAAVDAAQNRLAQLRLMLPIVERAEADALEAARTALDGDCQRQLARHLAALLKAGMQFSVHYQNAASAFRRMVQAGEECSRLLSDQQRRVGNGHLEIRLSGSGLRSMAQAEINRVGLLPFHARGVSAPGTDPRQVSPDYSACPQNLPSLEAEIRSLTARLLPAPAKAQERAEAQNLPR